LTDSFGVALYYLFSYVKNIFLHVRVTCQTLEKPVAFTRRRHICNLRRRSTPSNWPWDDCRRYQLHCVGAHVRCCTLIGGPGSSCKGRGLRRGLSAQRSVPHQSRSFPQREPETHTRTPKRSGPLHHNKTERTTPSAFHERRTLNVLCFWPSFCLLLNLCFRAPSPILVRVPLRPFRRIPIHAATTPQTASRVTETNASPLPSPQGPPFGLYLLLLLLCPSFGRLGRLSSFIFVFYRSLAACCLLRCGLLQRSFPLLCLTPGSLLLPYVPYACVFVSFLELS
jgi:hypothetical protein